ncbi:TIGR00730 family Rossman fold protein [Leucobacter denitrificans]|uniref:TIGR00730 family Rossman fold protein n=1 Tax=Leucobacter denitrificans TaxID=683042 RepID=A0A7G9S6R3_9MICO|nr:TIGR00730 family Rossman fold protein [Leucobacter denitrificans]QNN63538.1 TIGR00730 family Rossman fold protein [Leucobacter denitrificans]
MTTPVSPATADAIDDLLAAAEITKQRTLIRRILESGVGLGTDEASRLNLKITAAAVEEMRAAFRIFEPFTGIRKATIFGSARTQPGDLLSIAAEETARAFAEDDWMVVTGAGPGIMEAAATGAGPQQSLGVSIRLPFEEEPNAFLENETQSVAMKYFFTRKLMLVKESSAFICLPGGFGTMDETFELLTLQQTGKMVPVPIVLLDRAGGSYWRGFERFVVEEIEAAGFATPGDLERVLITDSADEAVAHVRKFWSNYQDLRWFPVEPGARAGGQDTLMLYVKSEPTLIELEELNERFEGLLSQGKFAFSDPFPEEGDNHAELARVTLIPKPRAVGELHRVINALNELPSALAATQAANE